MPRGLPRGESLKNRGKYLTFETMAKVSGLEIPSVRDFCNQFPSYLPKDKPKKGITVDKKLKKGNLVLWGLRLTTMKFRK
jgi:hypothetical protein